MVTRMSVKRRRCVKADLPGWKGATLKQAGHNRSPPKARNNERLN